MKTEYYYKFSAICSASSGILWIIGWTLNIGRDSLTGSSLALAGYVISIFAFFGINTIQRKNQSIVGFIGFVLIILANALFIPWVFLDMARVSGVAPEVDWWYVERNGPTGIVAIIGGFSFVFGFIIFAIDVLRAKILNRWPAYVLILAALQPALFPFIGVSKLLARIAGVALIGFAWNLWVLSKEKSIINENNY